MLHVLSNLLLPLDVFFVSNVRKITKYEEAYNIPNQLIFLFKINYFYINSFDINHTWPGCMSSKTLILLIKI